MSSPVYWNRPRNPWGFRIGYYTHLRLKELMVHIDAKTMNDIIKNLMDLREQHLSIKYRTSDQGGALELIKNELTRNFSTVFEGEKNRKFLHFAMQTLIQQHTKARAEEARRERRARAKIDVNVGGKTTLIDMLPETQGNINLDQDKENLDEENPVCVNGTFEVLTARPPVKEPLSARLPSNSKFSTVAPSGQTYDSIAQSEIYLFLNACKPCMIQYLRRFVDYGVTTSAYLYPISLWAPEKRYNLFKNILQYDPHDVPPSEIDLAILDNHLVQYFSEP